MVSLKNKKTKESDILSFPFASAPLHYTPFGRVHTSSASARVRKSAATVRIRTSVEHCRYPRTHELYRSCRAACPWWGRPLPPPPLPTQLATAGCGARSHAAHGNPSEAHTRTSRARLLSSPWLGLNSPVTVGIELHMPTRNILYRCCKSRSGCCTCCNGVFKYMS
jgi:hypothetical protein